MLDAVRRKVLPQRPAFRVVGHTYAPLQRIGVPADLTVENIGLIAWIKDDIGPWLWKPMQHVLPDKAEGKVFADLLLFDGFRDGVLEPLGPNTFPDLFSYADFEAVSSGAAAGVLVRRPQTACETRRRPRGHGAGTAHEQPGRPARSGCGLQALPAVETRDANRLRRRARAGARGGGRRAARR